MNQPSSTEQDRKALYKQSLNLPKTAFAMKANLVQNEPASLKRWDALGLYDRVQQDRADSDRFVFHDGPPYANGSIHLGHMLNKCLKDFVVRTRLMADKSCPYVPGWDCHGLPIEHKVMQELSESGKLAKLQSLADDARRMAIRRECRKYAEKYIKHQSGQMQRLLTLADYAHPYMTMDPNYEGAVLEVFAGLVNRGVVYRRLKAVHWSIDNETALADAELEYYDREDVSVFVDFEAADADGAAVYDAFGLTDEDARPDQRPCFMIWTTTPWTLPANLAIAVNPRSEYALVRMDGNITVVAAALVEKVAKRGGAEEVEVLATAPGERLLGLRYRHPFMGDGPDFSHQPAAAMVGAKPDRIYQVVAAEYVTLDDGTGLVHTAPGHGADDNATGVREHLPIYCPVRADGSYDASVPEWLTGKNIWKANTEITERLRTSGHLFYDHKFTHSYPHDWRGKTPVIFRATEQWFIGVDEKVLGCEMSMRDMAMTATGMISPDGPRGKTQQRIARESGYYDEPENTDNHPSHEPTTQLSPQVEEILSTYSNPPGSTRWGLINSIKFVPEWGRNRMRGMLESRPDWCISRQRAWGLPIPAFYTPDGKVLLTEASVRAVAKAFRQHPGGSDAWFTDTPEQLLRHYNPGEDDAAPHDLDLATLAKGHDIFDVWFESGSSWHAVIVERFGWESYPTDLYLEGSDQHRGWFQLSLLPALGVTGNPPFRTLLTHGFMVDKDGHKMSKSLGNALDVDELVKEFGADVCRWWIASIPFENDIKADLSFFKTAGEAYRKVRNTLRFMLSNLDDFVPSPPGKDCSSGQGMCVPIADYPPASIDAWALAEFDRLSARVRDAYEKFNFRAATEHLYNFCNDTLSAVYLAAVKDRLYCDKPDSPRRRRTQSTLWDLTDGLCRLLAPVMPHTADEAYRALLRADDACVHLKTFIEKFGVKAEGGWPKVMEARESALKALEEARSRGALENPLDAGVTLPDPDGELRDFDPVDLADLLGVSRVALDPKAKSPAVQDLRAEPRCDRSWKRDGTVKTRSDGGLLSDRDAAAVGVSWCGVGAPAPSPAAGGGGVTVGVTVGVPLLGCHGQVVDLPVHPLPPPTIGGATGEVPIEVRRRGSHRASAASNHNNDPHTPPIPPHPSPRKAPRAAHHPWLHHDDRRGVGSRSNHKPWSGETVLWSAGCSPNRRCERAECSNREHQSLTLPIGAVHRAPIPQFAATKTRLG